MEILKGGVKGDLFGLLASAIVGAIGSTAISIFAGALWTPIHLMTFVVFTITTGYFLVTLGAVLGIIYGMLKETRNPQSKQED